MDDTLYKLLIALSNLGSGVVLAVLLWVLLRENSKTFAAEMQAERGQNDLHMTKLIEKMNDFGTAKASADARLLAELADIKRSQATIESALTRALEKR